MITVCEQLPSYGEQLYKVKKFRFVFLGLSSDLLPEGSYKGAKIGSGSVFLAVDKNESRIYDEKTKKWYVFSLINNGLANTASLYTVPTYSNMTTQATVNTANVSTDEVISENDAKNIFDRAYN